MCQARTSGTRGDHVQGSDSQALLQGRAARALANRWVKEIPAAKAPAAASSGYDGT